MTFETKDVNTIVNDIIINLMSNVTDITDANVGSVIRQLIESISIEMEDLYDQINNVYLGSRVLTATADDLEQIGLIVGIERVAGTKASGNVTFRRLTPTTSSFTISQNAIVATQPNTGDEQLNFLVNAATVFPTSIALESHGYKDGVIDYRMNERFLGNTTQTTLVGSSASTTYAFVIETDFTIVQNYDDFLIDVDSIDTLDNCDTADWTEAQDAQAATTSSDKIEGTYSLNLGKNGTSSVYADYEKLISVAVDGSGKDIVVWLKPADQATIDKISKIVIYAGNFSIANSYQFELLADDINVGWDRYKFLTANAIENGSPEINAIDYLKIRIITNSSADTITLGDLKMDFWQVADTEDYYGDIIRWQQSGTKPDDDTNFKATYVPLSKEVACNAENVGDNYNVNKNKIIYKVSTIANITNINNYEAFSGGTDIETDTELRSRIQFAAEAAGKATAESIRQAVLSVPGVTSCSVDDMPRKSATSETHCYTSGITKFGLNFETLYLDNSTSPSNITLVGTVSSTDHTFDYGVDYQAVFDSYSLPTSEIEWLGATLPDDGTVVEVDYDYDWLGHVDVFVATATIPTPASLLTEIEDTVDDTKAAGILINVTTPTIITVDVTAQVEIDTDNGYTFDALQQSVEDAIYNYLRSREVGEDVYLAGITNAIMNITGILNSTISLPAADVVIDDDEIARQGTITITEI